MRIPKISKNIVTSFLTSRNAQIKGIQAFKKQKNRTDFESVLLKFKG
jgi:hypothetical protein